MSFFLIIAIFLSIYLVKKGAFFSPRAATVDISGRWRIEIKLTTPRSVEDKLLVDITQNDKGNVIGTVSDLSGENAEQFRGKVEDNQFKSEPTEIATGIYKATVIFEGAISSDGGQIGGNISGEVTKPLRSSLSGTFVAQRTSAPTQPPTSTPSPTATSTPLPTIISTATPRPTTTPIFSSPTPYLSPTLKVSPSPSPPLKQLPELCLKADVNLDGTLNTQDFFEIAKNYALEGKNQLGDLNQDKIVNALDLSFLLICLLKQGF